MNFRNLVLLYLLSYLILSCTLKPAIIHSGVINLDTKHKDLIEGLANKNDIIKILGETILKEYPDYKIWIYIETQQKKDFYGKLNLIKNDLLILELDDKGVLVKKLFLNKENLKQISFDETETDTYVLKNQFSKKFLASMRKRFKNLMKAETDN